MRRHTEYGRRSIARAKRRWWADSRNRARMSRIAGESWNLNRRRAYSRFNVLRWRNLKYRYQMTEQARLSGQKRHEADPGNLLRASRKGTKRGPDHPAWKGGITYLRSGMRRYGPDYRIGRRLALRRDGYRCRALGCRASYANGDRIETHHIVPREWDGSNHPSNLLTLCHFHHVRIWSVAFGIRLVRGCVLRFPRLQEKRYA